VPAIARFDGLVVAMYYNDHNPPHVHCKSAGRQVILKIEDGFPMKGELDRHDQKRAVEWVKQNRSELFHLWDRALAGEPLTWLGESDVEEVTGS
jgi:hypothetical protein